MRMNNAEETFKLNNRKNGKVKPTILTTVLATELNSFKKMHEIFCFVYISLMNIVVAAHVLNIKTELLLPILDRFVDNDSITKLYTCYFCNQ